MAVIAFGRDSASASKHGPTANYSINNCPDFGGSTVPNFLNLIRSRTVLDYGCGHGWQSVAMALNGAGRVLCC